MYACTKLKPKRLEPLDHLQVLSFTRKIAQLCAHLPDRGDHLLAVFLLYLSSLIVFVSVIVQDKLEIMCVLLVLYHYSQMIAVLNINYKNLICRIIRAT